MSPSVALRAASRLSRQQLLGTRCLSQQAHGSRAQTIGFIGLGQMGANMAQNLFSKHQEGGVKFVVCDANVEGAKAFVERFKANDPARDVRVVQHPSEVIAAAQTVFTVLPSSPQVQDVYLNGNNSLLSVIKALPEGHNTFCIDSTTLDVQVAQDVAKRVEGHGGRMVDAPVSGGVAGAKAGTLAFLVGGPPASFALAQPYLAHMGSKIIHCGPSGSGLAAKICNNLILGIQQIAVAEGMLLGQRMGLKADVLAGVVNSSTGRCWSSETNNPVPKALNDKSPPCERDFDGGFATVLMLKDMNLALQAAAAFSSPLPLGDAAKQLYAEVADQKDLARKDFSVVYRHLERLEQAK